MRCLVALLFLAGAAFAQSSQPPASGNSPSAQGKQEAAPDQSGTQQSPLIVKITPAQDADKKTADEQRDREEKAAIDRKLAFETQRIADYTGWLATFTALVAAVTGFLGYATWTAATAAKNAANAVVSQLRAYLRVSLMEPPTIDAERVLKVSVGIKNTGQTPAYDADIVSNVGIISWPAPSPLETIFIETEAQKIVKITIAGGDTTLNIPEMPNVSSGEEAGLKAGAYRVIVWGRVRYTDTFKKPRTTRYAFSLKWEGDKFGPPFYESVGNTSD
ncbi:MAG: hypothetical protein WD039_09150 [Xanthobacteraceae bacterium]